MTRRRTLVALGFALVAAPVIWLGLVAADSEFPVSWIVRKPEPAEALARFYTYEGGEDMLMDPLILAGPGVNSAVVQAIESPDMPRRRYAIGYLGNAGAREALPALRRILADDAELDYFRGDALNAIYEIDPNEGLSSARPYTSRTDYLGRVAGQIAAGTRRPFRRSYLDALQGRHD